MEQAYEDALRAYTEAQVELPEAPELFYDIGNVLFRQGDLAGAEEAWTRAMAGADGDLLAEISLNLGNARYQRQAFQEAVDAYSQALAARPEDRDTKRNLELALRRLQAQQQQQQQEPQDGDPKQENEDSNSGPQDQEKQDPQQGQQPKGETDPGEQDPAQQPAGGEMTREEAARLLDSLEAQEKDNLKKEEEVRKRARAGERREKDW